MDTVVIGVSADTLDLQQKFTEKEHLNFPLLADPEKKVIRAFGALAANGIVASRNTYVIDKQGVVRKVYIQANAASHPEEVVKFVQEHLAKK